MCIFGIIFDNVENPPYIRIPKLATHVHNSIL